MSAPPETPAVKNKVLESFENPEATHCVDIFVRGDGSFGFEEFRRDAEDGGLWQCLHKYGNAAYETGPLALDAAKDAVAWLDKALVWRW